MMKGESSITCLWLSSFSWSFALRASSSGLLFLSAGLGSNKSLPRQREYKLRPSWPCRLFMMCACQGHMILTHFGGIT